MDVVQANERKIPYDSHAPLSEIPWAADDSHTVAGRVWRDTRRRTYRRASGSRTHRRTSPRANRRTGT